jgi:hypothetical protein
VGATSAAMTAGAHAAGGGGLPGGASSVIALLTCAMVGALVATLRLQERGARWLTTSAALIAAQLLGHLTLATAGHHHTGGGLGLDASMVAAHVGAAIILGLAISAAEYLYVVCASVLCWLRLFATSAPRPIPRAARAVANAVVLQHIFVTGLGMRAPPAMMPANA